MAANGGLLKISLKKRLLRSQDIDRHAGLQPGPYIEFTVEDTGHGIPEELLPYIFDPYFTTKEAGTGTGLGLAVVHGIINDYGGAIAVASEQGKGSVFTIHLPVAETKELTAPDIIQTPESLSGHGERILVVDDEQAILKLCTRLLEGSGYTVRTETDPRIALNTLREDPRAVDLLLCDLTMPHLTGDKLAMLVHQAAPSLPIILMSGNRMKLEETQAADDIILRIPKPINNNSLLEMITVLLRKTM
jgi:CheY-like chemotaxis protein